VPVRKKVERINLLTKGGRVKVGLIRFKTSESGAANEMKCRAEGGGGKKRANLNRNGRRHSVF